MQTGHVTPQNPGASKPSKPIDWSLNPKYLVSLGVVDSRATLLVDQEKLDVQKKVVGLVIVCFV